MATQQVHRKVKGIEKTGIVVSDRQDKTRIVMVERIVRHPLYQKTMRRLRKFVAHDPENISRVGDKVVIRQCRPLSRTKRWTIVHILQPEKSIEKPREEI